MTARVEDLSHLPGWPRLLSPEQAAAYMALSPSSFRKHVTVKALRLGGIVRYDRLQLDRYVEALGQAGPVPDWADTLFK
ncbi:DNA-binding protein [Pararhodospirillum photometricum]|uniref:Helix-turn-helix domain-containing protein n=1 Tax=Pararhodospirillum photometricum DSM 122 TaxID=1150469 RepID=H6SNX5_PARPM|nr:DNA-binding protein [Pararhodospirillum photometricum]CCG07047.1 unnamed protein product [Pararhodospirillum photometricum DSM 122]